jgi:type IV fimbrial biogenesis protein FimT
VGARGLTLVELLVALAILAIVTTTAVPGFLEFARRNQLASQSNQLVSALHLARSEAVRRSTTVGLCASSDGQACTGPDAEDWSVGWIVFVDTGSPGAPGVGEVLRIWPAQGVAARIAGPDHVQYQAVGDAVAPATFELHYSGCEGPYRRIVSVLPAGRPETATSAC